jgi:1,3-beta-glucan synthase
MAGPTFFTTVVENQPGGGGSLVLILNFTQFFIISIGTIILFGIMPSSRTFGDRVASKLRKYFASHTFNS